MKNTEYKSFNYRLLKPLVMGIFDFYYNPTRLNKENIPAEGPIIVCGNHRHLMDQFMVIGATKRMLHYMAKKEYFDDKRKAWFFKMTGCIPVDRQNHGGNSKEIAKKVLDNNHALGIYPEGTRNNIASKDEKLEIVMPYIEDIITIKKYKKLAKKIGIKYTQTDLLIELYKDKKIKLKYLKEALLDPDNKLKELLKKKVIKQSVYDESLLIPFKFGTVSLAQKTNATIVPYSIVGDYSFRSKNLKVIIGKPFKVGDMTLEEANNKLTKEILRLIKEN